MSNDNFIPEWSQQKMLEGLAVINKICSNPNYEEEFTASNDAGQALFILLSEEVLNMPDEDMAFIAVLEEAVRQNKIDITCPEKVNVTALQEAFLQAKENFLSFIENGFNMRDINLIPD